MIHDVTDKLNEKMVKIEAAISAWLRPSFLGLMKDPVENSIHIVVSHGLFRLHSVPKRVEVIMGILNEKCPEVFLDTCITTEAYDNDEMEDVIDYALGD